MTLQHVVNIRLPPLAAQRVMHNTLNERIVHVTFERYMLNSVLNIVDYNILG
jgi:hypothetical protein